MVQSSHSTNVSLSFIKHAFSDRLISRNGDILWPARLPHLPVRNFILRLTEVNVLNTNPKEPGKRRNPYSTFKAIICVRKFNEHHANIHL